MSQYKLVVIAPFNEFKVGQQISDPDLVNNFLNPDHHLFDYSRHCVKVLKSVAEMQQVVIESQLQEEQQEEEQQQPVLEAQDQPIHDEHEEKQSDSDNNGDKSVNDIDDLA